MGDKVTMGEGLLITVVSMVVVFVVLLIISYLIGFLKSFSEGRKKNIDEPATSINIVKEEDIVEDNNEELVAVISAAIAASLGLDVPDINIQVIRRIPQNSTPWAEMGRREQLTGKL